MITFKSLNVGSSYLHMRRIYTDYGSSSHMKVIRVTGAKKVENSYSHNVQLRLAITPVLSNIERGAVMFACSMGFSDTADLTV